MANHADTSKPLSESDGRRIRGGIVADDDLEAVAYVAFQDRDDAGQRVNKRVVDRDDGRDVGLDDGVASGETKPYIASFDARDAKVISGWGFPICEGVPVAVDGPGFGWGQDHVAAMVDGYPNFDLSNCTRVEHDLRSPVGLLSFPGAYTYGHWLLDIPSRLELLSCRPDFDTMSFIVPGPLIAWTLPILAAYGIGVERLLGIGDRQYAEISDLVVPSFSRCSDYLPPYPFANAFARIKAHWRDGRDIGAARQNLYVRHKPMTSQGHRANLARSEVIENALVERGFAVVEPGVSSRDEVNDRFARADIIVGEDSSALHNIIYAGKAKVIVLSSQSRVNLLHYSLAKRLGMDCDYVFGAESDEGFVVDTSDILTAVGLAT